MIRCYLSLELTPLGGEYLGTRVYFACPTTLSFSSSSSSSLFLLFPVSHIKIIPILSLIYLISFLLPPSESLHLSSMSMHFCIDSRSHTN